MTITLTREEAQQVLNELSAVWKIDRSTSHDKAMETLRAQLAQPEQEPVAWGVPNTRPTEKAQFMMLLHSADGCQYPDQLVPLYTAPPQREWQGLTDEDIAEESGAAKAQNHMVLTLAEGFFCGARWAEAKLKEKNG